MASFRNWYSVHNPPGANEIRANARESFLELGFDHLALVGKPGIIVGVQSINLVPGHF